MTCAKQCGNGAWGGIRLSYKLVPASVGQSSAGLGSHTVNDVYRVSTSWVPASHTVSVFTISYRGASTTKGLSCIYGKGDSERVRNVSLSE